ncbi:MAG: hypothetical protein ACI9VR_002011 [Cognaticolwellia sp.]
MSAVLALLLGGVLLGLWAWLVVASGRWPAGDGPHVLGTGQRLAQFLRDGEPLLFVRCLGMLIGPHPPGAYLPATLAAVVLGPGRWVHLAAGALVVGLCLDGIRRLGGGLSGWIWLGASPLIWLQAEGYGVDLVAAACVVQALSHLHVSEGLSRRRHVVLWGLWMGACFISKYTAPMFLWAPCLAAGLAVLRSGRWKALGTGVLAFGLVALPVWGLNGAEILGYLTASQSSSDALMTNDTLLGGPWATPERLSWYPRALVDHWGWPGALLAGVALVLPFREKGLRRSAWLLPTLGVLGGVLILATQSQRQDRYLVPAVVLLCALLGSLRWSLVLAPIGAVGLYGVAMSFLRWTDVPATRSYTHSAQLSELGQTWPWVQDAYAPTSQDPGVWELDARIAQLALVHGSPEGSVGFLLDETGGAPGFGLVLSRVVAADLRWHVATVMVLPNGEAAVFVGPFTRNDWPSRDFGSLLVILRTGDGAREAWLRRSGLELRDSWPLPEGREGRIYQSPDGEPMRFLEGR